MKTIKLPYICYSDDEQFLNELHGLQKTQSSIYRVAYKRASEGLAEIEIRSSCRNLFPNTDSWVIQSAVKKGIGQFKADWELAKSKGEEFTGKRIFGGKKNFFRRIKNLITHDQFQEFKIENLYLIGEALHGGNRKFDFHIESITFKPHRGVKYEFSLPKLHGFYSSDYIALVKATTQKSIPVTVSLNKDFIFLSYEETLLEKHKPKKIIKGRYLGIDLNPNYIGVSYFNEKQELLDTRLYNFKELTGKNINADKLKHELREVAIDIGSLAQHYQIQYLFIEDLHFKQGDTGFGKNFNRLVKNQFLISEFEKMLSKFGKVVTVNAAYSSTIGNVVNEAYPDPVAASMEIARRGIESRIVKASKRFYPPLVPKEILQRRWKDVVIPDFDSWIELHNWLKSTGLKYRVPIPDLGMFRPFSNINSGVYVFR
jgi:hypothetical protein